MGNHTEQFEGQQQAEAKSFNSSLSSYMTERPDPAMNARELQTKSGDLVAQGALPSLELFSAPPDVQPGYGGRIASREDLREAGIKCERKTEDNGDKTVNAEFPNGVKISITDGQVREGSRPGTTIDTSTSILEGAQEKPLGSGHFVDKTGREIAQKHSDGSYTVDGGNGKFFTVEADGTITKASAIRSRDGKKFEVLDTDNPLGGVKK